jgi:hypothetical protein
MGIIENIIISAGVSEADGKKVYSLLKKSSIGFAVPTDVYDIMNGAFKSASDFDQKIAKLIAKVQRDDASVLRSDEAQRGLTKAVRLCMLLADKEPGKELAELGYGGFDDPEEKDGEIVV